MSSWSLCLPRTGYSSSGQQSCTCSICWDRRWRRPSVKHAQTGDMILLTRFQFCLRYMSIQHVSTQVQRLLEDLEMMLHDEGTYHRTPSIPIRSRPPSIPQTVITITLTRIFRACKSITRTLALSLAYLVSHHVTISIDAIHQSARSD